MAWVYLDDQFPDHPKVVIAGGDAAWLFVCGLAYCRRQETAGRIPKPQVARLTDRKQPARLASRLVEVGLWEDDGDFYVIHDYSDWNKPQESRSAAGRKAARARWDKERNANAHAIASETHMPSHESADASTCPPPLPYPLTAGDESPNGSEPTPKPAPKRRATALPASWQPNDAHRALAREKTVDVDREREQFIDFHAAKGSTFKDWDAAFRTWLRNAETFGKPTQLRAVNGNAGGINRYVN